MIPAAPTIVMVRKTDLAIHATVKRLPLDREVVASIQAGLEDGDQIHDALEINAENEVLDGRHRLLASLPVKRITHLPCWVNGDAEGREATNVILKRALRCHWTKSALAYALLPEFEIAVAEAVAARAANLKQGGDSPKRYSIPLREPKGSDDIATKYGVSVEMLKLARHTAKLFGDSDKLIEKWLSGNSHEALKWHEAARDLDQPWTRWRETRLLDMGHNLKDPATAAVIPENYREIFEAQLFAGEMGLGQINKALGSILATKGKIRSDLDTGDTALHLALCNKVTSFNKTMWANWAEIPVPGRTAVIQQLTGCLTDWPQEVRVSLFATLKDQLKKS
jgi:hypothetical protein